jgi:hypothetical protein
LAKQRHGFRWATVACSSTTWPTRSIAFTSASLSFHFKKRSLVPGHRLLTRLLQFLIWTPFNFFKWRRSLQHTILRSKDSNFYMK